MTPATEPPPRGSMPSRSDQSPLLAIHPEVAEALAHGWPVVALESTIVAHGLPRPENLRVARLVESSVRARGAVPATIAILAGQVLIGLTDPQLEEIAQRDDVAKVSVRDLGSVIARGIPGATTVAATSHCARLAGINVFATGGLGGVHREARETWDESADLTTLAEVTMVVVCAGVKSILDVPATLERLETLNVPVLGYGTSAFPGFYLSDSGSRVDWQVDSAQDVASIVRARHDLHLEGAVIVANPLPSSEQMDPEQHDRLLAEGMSLAAQHGVRGKAVTPFLLDYFHRASGGLSLSANATIIERNAILAADIAVAMAGHTAQDDATQA